MKEKRNKISLDDIRKDQVFQVPTGYFEALPDRIKQQMAEEKDKFTPVRPLSSRWMYYAAACLAAIMVVWFSLKTPQKEESPEILLSEVSTNDMINYLKNSDISAIDISLTEEDQEEILEDQLNNFEIPDNYDVDVEYLEEYL